MSAGGADGLSADCDNSAGLLDCEPDPVGCPLGDGSTAGGTIVSGAGDGVDAEEEEVSPEQEHEQLI